MVSDSRCQILAHQPCGPHLYRLSLQSVDTPFSCIPGQFVMVDLPSDRFFFRRPFSVLSVQAPHQFDLYYKVVGQGTTLMANLEPGEFLQVLGPLGQGFSMPNNPSQTLVIGGGIGIAPLYFLAQQCLQQKGEIPYCVYGVRNEAEIGLLEPLTQLFPAHHLAITTDDGSYGFHGNVCHWIDQHQDLVLQMKTVYICGPTAMMAAASRQLEQLNPHLEIYVSLEEHMPCGTGACGGCVVSRADQLLPAKVCLEGPVFKASQVQWKGSLALGKASTEEVTVCSR